MRVSRGGRPGLPVPNSLYGLCVRKATFEKDGVERERGRGGGHGVRRRKNRVVERERGERYKSDRGRGERQGGERLRQKGGGGGGRLTCSFLILSTR